MKIASEKSIVEKLENYTGNVVSLLWLVNYVMEKFLRIYFGCCSPYRSKGPPIPNHGYYITFYLPCFWFQCLSFGIVLLVWLQHVFLRVCIIIVAEKNFTKGGSPYFRMFKDTTGIDGEVLVDYLVVFETGALVGLTMGLLRQMSVFIYEFYGIEI